MTQKTKRFAVILSMFFVITLGVVGIFAVKHLSLSVGGDISFFADGLSFEVSNGAITTVGGDEYTNILTETGKMQGFEITTDKKLSDVQEQLNTWTGLNLMLDKRGDAVLHFSVTNKMSTILFAHITITMTGNKNENMNVVVSPNGTDIRSGDTKDFAITFDILNQNINAGLSSFDIAVDFDRGEKLLMAQYKNDPQTGLETQEIDYYFLEMGTYNGVPVKWRYVADINGEKYTGVTAPTTLRGYYVLETMFETKKYFLHGDKYNTTTYKNKTEGYTNINTNDYGISDVRAYLTNEGSGGFMRALGISGDNVIFSMISGRTITDLYSNILNSNGKPIDITNTSYSLSLTGDKDISNQSDKFWLMSYQEAQTFLGAQSARVWGTGKTCWLRSPLENDANDCFSISSSGEISTLNVRGSYGIRAAFKIDF